MANQPSTNHTLKQILKMGACCAGPILGLALLAPLASSLGIGVSSIFSFLLVLACPLGMLMMMYFMNRRTRWWLGGISLALILASVGWVGAGEAQGLGAPMEHVHALVLDHVRHTLLLGTHQGLSRSQDEGKTWSKVDTTGDVPSTDFMALAIDPTNPQTLYAAGHGLWVIKSSDGGTTWTLKKQGLDGDDVHGLALDPNDPQNLYAWVVDKGLYRSTNGGEAWARVDDGPKVPVTFTPTEVKGLLSVNLSTGMGGIYVAAATASGVFFSADCF